MTAMSGVPAYVQVAADIRKKITAGTLATGAQLPSMAQLRETYAVSNTVIRDALNELRREGLVVGQQGKGVFVQEHLNADSASGQADDIAEIHGELADLRRRVGAIESRLRQDEPEPRTPGKDGQ